MTIEKKELEKAIKYYQLKIQGQGMVTNARDEEILEKLMAVYKERKGK
tara:strand:- start:193 stop:336 length:144 start_codon:yes stop_codon:yes gene_type:complete